MTSSSCINRRKRSRPEWKCGNAALCPLLPARRRFISSVSGARAPRGCKNHRGILLNLPNRKTVTYLTKDGVQERISWRRTMTFNSQINGRDAMLMGGGIIRISRSTSRFRESKRGRSFGDARLDPASSYRCLFATENAYRKKRVRYFLDWLEVRFRKMLEHTNREYQWVA